MQAAIDQVCWVPIGDIMEPDDACFAQREDDMVMLSSTGDGRYILLAGKNRLHALKEQGRCFVDAVICPSETLNTRLSHLTSQLMKGELHYLDEAAAYRAFVRGDGLSTRELSERTGRSVQTVQKKIRLLNLGEEVCALLRDNRLSEGIAEALLRMPGQQGRLRVLRHVVERKLSVKEAEALIDELLARMPVPVAGGQRMKPMMRDYRLYLNAIRGIVEQMQDAGLGADMQVRTGRAAVDVRISVPIFTQNK